MTDRPLYNFRLAPEAIWLIVNTVLGTVLLQVAAAMTDWDAIPSADDLQAWGISLGVSAVRTLIGAILAAATGQFLKPGEVPATPTKG